MGAPPAARRLPQLSPRLLTAGVVVAGVLLLLVGRGVLDYQRANEQLGALRQAVAALAKQAIDCPTDAAAPPASAAAAAASSSSPAAALAAPAKLAGPSGCQGVPALDAPRPRYEAVVPELADRPEDVLPDVAAAVLAAERDGRGRKIIATWLVDGNNDQWPNVLDNAQMVGQHWPGWTLRIYFTDRAPECPLRLAAGMGVELVRIPQPRSYDSAVRFLETLQDRAVSRMVVRNTDTRLTPRDKAAVDEWVESGRYFHVLHDSSQHTEPIMDGMYGAVNGFVHPRLVQRVLDSTGDARQQWLTTTLWPLVQNQTLDHAAYTCRGGYGRSGAAAETRAFPTQRNGTHDFVGNSHWRSNAFQGNPHSGACPAECRRQPDWQEC